MYFITIHEPKKGNKIIGKVKDPWKTYFEAKN
jgi:hypothetical protein